MALDFYLIMPTPKYNKPFPYGPRDEKSSMIAQRLNLFMGNVTQEGGEGGETEASRKDVLLRSKGLCLVPIELTLHVADTNLNGADFWSPAAMMNNNITQ
ncbi:hypothetical protein T459_32196 [Capsicum annuum]|uniref:Uncharacterized protein n=1 Tax=Capsicum annuum TaxID=4072 RepID=A0A2G2Y2D1_CAPAN|nr:hypothetical protein T459_32196 [Capsicum annuum]